MAWEKKPAIAGGHHPCLCCGVIASVFPKEGYIAVGFGYAGLTKDGREVWSEPNDAGDIEDERIMRGEDAEKMAAADPDHDWRIHLEGPLAGRTYQRHDVDTWVLIERNEGFA